MDLHYDGRPRRWFQAFGANAHLKREMTDRLQDLYGGRAKLVEARLATEEEESAYLRGTEPENMMLPGRGTLSAEPRFSEPPIK